MVSARPHRSRRTWVGACVVAVVLVFALVAPGFTRDPERPDLTHGLEADGAPRSPSTRWWLGTDDLGRDVLARLAAGGRRSIAIAGLATAIAVTLGLALGLAAGLRGGAVDAATSASIDVTLGVPTLLVAALATATAHAAAIDLEVALIVTLAALGWPSTARVVRAETGALRAAEFVTAARALGAGWWRVTSRHVAPALATTVAALAIATLATNLVLEAGLGYLGLGAPPPTPSWGRMVADGQPYLREAPWLVLAPGLAIATTLTGFTLVAQGLRDAK